MGYMENIENNFKKAKTEIENLKQNMSSLQSLSDIETSLSGKANSSDLSEVAFSGDYNDLANKPDNSALLSVINNKADAFDVGYGLQKGFDTSNAWTTLIPFTVYLTSWSAITYDNNKFVALSQNGYITTSTDGTTWTEPVYKFPSDLNWSAIAYGNNKFVALGIEGYPRVATSTDGTTWTYTQMDEFRTYSDKWYKLVYGNNKFVIMSRDGYISTSTDGTTWTTPVYKSILGDNDWSAIAYGDNKFVMINDAGTISTSTDGTTWTTPVRQIGITGWNAITYGNNKFVAISSDGYMSTSTDGITWTIYTKTNLGANGWTSLTYGNNKFVALSYYGSVSIQTIYDSDSLCVTNTLFDSPWAVYKTTLSSSNLAVGTYSLNSQISSYLPNDEYYYEVEIFLKYESKSTTVTTVSFNDEIFFYGDAYGSSNQECKSMRGSIIINPNRALSMKIENAKPAVLEVTALRYRRLGTNV